MRFPAGPTDSGRGIPYYLCNDALLQNGIHREYANYKGRCRAYAVVNQDIANRSKVGVVCGTAAVATDPT